MSKKMRSTTLDLAIKRLNDLLPVQFSATNTLVSTAHIISYTTNVQAEKISK